MPVVQDTAPTYREFLTRLCAEEAPGDVTDIFGSWRYDSDSDGISFFELGQRMELASPPDSLLTTPMSESFVTALSDTLVVDLSFNVFNGLEFDQSIEITLILSVMMILLVPCVPSLISLTLLTLLLPSFQVWRMFKRMLPHLGEGIPSV
jgi:hypothetical protein